SFILRLRPPPSSTPFPYTTLFRSHREARVSTVISQFEEQAARRPDAVALSGGGTTWKYGSLNARANRLAQRLLQAGAGMETRVRSEEHTSELQSRGHLVCRLLLEK